MKQSLKRSLHQSWGVVMMSVGIVLGMILGVVFRINCFGSIWWVVFAILIFVLMYLKPRFLTVFMCLVAGKVPVIKKGWFADFSDSDLPEKIAFCFLDGDFYESIRDGLKLIENKMSRSGVLIVHDYDNPELPGVKKAVDEWAGTRVLQVLETCAIIRGN